MEYKIVDSELWEKCEICGKETKELERVHHENRNRGSYFSERFEKHILEHGTTLHEYFKRYRLVDFGTCACGCGTPVVINFRGKFLVVRRYIQYHSTENDPLFLESVERNRTSRLGSGNPMYGKEPWNLGKTKDDNDIIKRTAENRRGCKLSEEHKRHIRESWDHSYVARHAVPHSEETKDKLRRITLDQIKRGVFSQTRTKPHLAFAALLDEMGIKYEEEKGAGFFSIDFYLPEYDLYVEIDGDYFHSNPAFYPNGPKTATQKINHYRDIKKDKFCLESGLRVIRIWENEITKKRSSVMDRMYEETGAIRKDTQC